MKQTKRRILRLIDIAQERVRRGSNASGCFAALRSEIEILDIDSNQSNTEQTTIPGWVARDKEGYINLFEDKPQRNSYDNNDVCFGFWDNDNGHHIKLPLTSFPTLKWIDEPQEVEITLKYIIK